MNNEVNKLRLAALCFVLVLSSCAKQASNSNTTAKNQNANKPAQTATASPAASSAGEVYTHAAGGIQFEVPAGWTAKQDGDQMMIGSPDGGVSVIFQVASEDTWEAALNALDDELGKVIKGIKPNGEPKEGTHAGMNFVSQSGTGTVEGTTVAWEVTLLAAKKPVIVVGFAAPELWSKNEGAYSKLVDSVKKAS